MMAEIPAMPTWVERLLADTNHLTNEEFGAYFRMICIAWLQPSCDLPNDQEWIARRLGRIPEHEFERLIQPLIDEFWRENKRHRLEQKGQQKVRAEVKQKIANRKTAAARRWKKKKSADAMHMREHTTSHMQPKPKPKPKPKPNVEEYTPSNTENLESTERADADIDSDLSLYTQQHANGHDPTDPDIGLGDDTTPTQIGDEVAKAMARAKAASLALKKIQ